MLYSPYGCVQLPALLDVQALHAEVDRISKAGHGSTSGLWLPSLPRAKAGSEASGQLLAMLLKWASTICAKSGLEVRSWAGSFADGRAICLLVGFIALLIDHSIPQPRPPSS